MDGRRSALHRFAPKIDGEITKVKPTTVAAWVRKYEKTAKAEKTNPKSQFAWGYAVVKARKLGYAAPNNHPIAQDISWALALVPSPQTYQFARLRFVTGMWWRFFLDFKGLGKRLLARNPNDYEVKYYLAQIFAVGGKSDRQQALSWAREMVKIPSKRSS